MSIAPCPRLLVEPGRVIFTDSTGQPHDLLNDQLLAPGEAARRMNRSTEWVRQKVRQGKLYPVLRGNRRDVQIFACAIIDFRARQLIAQNAL